MILVDTFDWIECFRGRELRKEGLAMLDIDASLPGAEIFRRGLDDLQANIVSVPAIALQLIAPRLERVGIVVPRLELNEDAELALYRRLDAEQAPDVYGTYNSLRQRLWSLAAALEAEYYREMRGFGRP